VARELRAASFALEDREFVAHVTLARRGERPAALPPLPPIEWPVSDFVLVRSQPSAGGSNYAVLERFGGR
jgi:2'-5' RNA ligase